MGRLLSLRHCLGIRSKVTALREREKLPLTMTAGLEISGEKSAGGEEQSAVGEEQYADVDMPSLEDSTKNSNGKHYVGKRARIEHPEVLFTRSSGHRHSRDKEREKLPLTMTTNLEISSEKSVGGEEQSAVGKEQYADVDMPSLEDSTENSNGRHSVGKRARIEHPEVQVISFKVPFSLECKGCESVIAKGVTINAEKKLVGNYYEKKIWSFTVECGYCGQKIVMERVSNDSKYIVMKGTREKSAKNQGKGKQVDGRHFQEFEQQPWYSRPDLKYRYHGFTLLAMVNEKARDDFFKARGY